MDVHNWLSLSDFFKRFLLVVQRRIPGFHEFVEIRNPVGDKKKHI